MKKLLLFGLCVLFAGAMVEIQAAGIALNSEDQLVAAINEIMTKINTFVQGLPGGENGLNEFQREFLKRLNGQAGRRQSKVFLQEVADFLDVLMALAPQKTKDLNSIKSLKDKANALFVVQQEREQQARVAPSVEDVAQPPVAPMPPASVKKMPPPVAPKPASKLEPVALPVEPVRAASPVETAPIVAPEVDVAPVTDTAPQIIAPEQGEPQRVPTPAHSDDEFDFGDGTVSTLPAALAPIVISGGGNQDFDFDDGYPSELPAAVAPIVITRVYDEDFAFGDDSHPAVILREPSPVVAPVPTVVAPREPSPVPVAAIAAAVAPLAPDLGAAPSEQGVVVAQNVPFVAPGTPAFTERLFAAQKDIEERLADQSQDARGAGVLNEQLRMIPGFELLDPQLREILNPLIENNGKQVVKPGIDGVIALAAANVLINYSIGQMNNYGNMCYLGKRQLSDDVIRARLNESIELLGGKFGITRALAQRVKDETGPLKVDIQSQKEAAIFAIQRVDELCFDEEELHRAYQALARDVSRSKSMGGGVVNVMKSFVKRRLLKQSDPTSDNFAAWFEGMIAQLQRMKLREEQADLILEALRDMAALLAHPVAGAVPLGSGQGGAMDAPTEFGLELLITHLELRLRLLEKLGREGLINLSPEDIVHLYFRPNFNPGWLHEEFQRVMRENNVQSHDVRRLTELVRNVRPGAGEEDIARLVKAIQSGLKDEAKARREILEEPTVPFFWEELGRYAKAEPVLGEFGIDSKALLASMIQHFRYKLRLVLQELRWQFANGEPIEPSRMSEVLQQVLPGISEDMTWHLSKELLALQPPTYR